MSKKAIFVLDTNIVVDYVDVIPSEESAQPEDPTIDLSEAHIVIPTVVVRELSSFKKEASERGRAARTALRRIRGLMENCGLAMDEVYDLKRPLQLQEGKQEFSIYPIKRDFRDDSFKPSDSDMDGQIILATLSILQTMTERNEDVKVTLLTNDNGLAIRAAARGLNTSRYGYKYPTPYSGRRDLVVPDDLFDDFLIRHRIEREDWETAMPKEPTLVANEFIIMTPEREKDNPVPELRHFSDIGRFDAEEQAIVPLKYVYDFVGRIENAGQAIYAEALLNPKIALVICTGPAGTGKTYMATTYGYNACREGDYIGVTVVPCRVEDDSVGFLPGDLNDKLDPNVQPIKNALSNYLIHEDKDIRKLMGARKKDAETGQKKERGAAQQAQKSVKERLRDQVDQIWNNWFDNVPIEYARGRDFAYQIAIFDEFQDQNRSQADTLIKRIGQEGKIIITGDIEQVHAAYLDRENNGLVYARRLLMDTPMVAQVTFTENEVIRHPLVRLVTQRQKNPDKKA